jgi:hypothetical protein
MQYESSHITQLLILGMLETVDIDERIEKKSWPKGNMNNSVDGWKKNWYKCTSLSEIGDVTHI